MLGNADSIERMVSDQIRLFLSDRLGFDSFDRLKKGSPLSDVLVAAVDKIVQSRAKPIIDKIEKDFKLNKRQEADSKKSFTEGYEEVVGNLAYEAGKNKAENDKADLFKSMGK